jgi:glycosyltransferase involved in cell wall biosynthesis
MIGHGRMQYPLSVIILTRNEVINIQRCIEAVSWCNDVVVVDDRSTDGTDRLAMASGARVVQHPFIDFADQRNWAMENADLKNEWVLHLDADEVVTSELASELRQMLSAESDACVAYRMCRKTMFQGTWLRYSDGFPVWIMRLVRKGKVGFRSSGHGEVAVPDVDGRLGTIREPFLHYAFSKGIGDWIERHNRYSSREAELEYRTMQSLVWQDLWSVDRARRRASLRALSRRLPLRPFLRFCYQYFIKLGFLDGSGGWTFSRLMATYEGWIVLKRQELERNSSHHP